MRVTSINKKKMRIKTDKSGNIYKIDPPLYEKILHNKIAGKYKLDYKRTDCQIDNDTYKLTNKFNIKNKRSARKRKSANIFFKYLKENSEND